MKRRSTAGPTSIASPELQIVNNENFKLATEPAPSSSVEHKETYVNMMYPSTAASCSTEIPTGTIESPDDDDDVEMVKNNTKKTKKFRLNLMKSGSYKLKQSPELSVSPGDDKLTLERQKPASSSRLKKLFMLSRADPSRKRQKDVSLKNLRHVL